MARYSVGIDLGTTNCALAYSELGDAAAPASSPAANSGIFAIPQLSAAGVVEALPLLPSFLYLASDQEFAAVALSLPWAAGAPEAGSSNASAPQAAYSGTSAEAARLGLSQTAFTGVFARKHGAKVPTRLVSSAKSWLCHPGVDRQSALLPWQAPAEVQRISPLDASAAYLSHLRSAWDAAHPEAPLATQEVVLTVPASFDAAARDLTLLAAERAGLSALTLLEEPQAAFYAWINQSGGSFRKQIRPGDVVLVIDVGGGTSDFSLISVTDNKGDLELTRLAVGDHILLGGDNMDLALAYSVVQRLAGEGKKLDAWQITALTHACRQAKELLYSDPALAAAPLVIPGRGTSLIGGTLRTELTREVLERVLTDGFFPLTEVSASPATARRSGLTQLALPYAQDAAITRHLAAFLTRQARALASVPGAPVLSPTASFVHPSAVLFNGGAFKANPLRERVLTVLNNWLTAEGAEPLRELQGADLDLSVARGAAHYGAARLGGGLRIRGGTARAYYVGVETAMMAVPGMEPPVKALCLAPFGMEEGTQADVPPQEFGLVVGEPTKFRFFSSSLRRNDRVGELYDDPDTDPDFEELAPLETSLTASTGEPGGLIPINLQAAVTELGVLELRCLERHGERRWKLELNVRMKD